MKDSDILKSLQVSSAPCTETLGAKAIYFCSDPAKIKMQFEAIHEFTHSDGKVVQGGFVTGMLDAPMAHLLMGLFEFKVNPMTLDLNISFLAPTRQGCTLGVAEVLQLGKSIAFMKSSLFQDDRLIATATSTVRLVPVN